MLQLPTIRPCLGITASNLPAVCGVGAVACTRSDRKGQYNIDTDMLQLQLVDGEEPHPSKCRGCSHAKEEMRKRKSQGAPELTTVRVFSSSPHHPRPIFRGCATQQQQPQPPSDEQACPTSLEAQLITSIRSVQAPNVNSSSLSDMFSVVATVLQQIMREINGTKSEEDSITTIIKIILKLMKQTGC
jgi:hypothetical protein